MIAEIITVITHTASPKSFNFQQQLASGFSALQVNVRRCGIALLVHLVDVNFQLSRYQHFKQLPAIFFQLFPGRDVVVDHWPHELHVLTPKPEDIEWRDGTGL